MRMLAALLIVASSALAQSRGPVYYDYQRGSREALRTGKPLLVFVGHVPRFSDTTSIHATTPHLEGYPSQCVVVARPKDGTLWWSTTLPISGKAVSAPVADPFRFVQQRGCPT